ncbi:Crp/Fnr family transcriptional regulator [Aureibacter tunicatorum]|uniref:CRP-like cAMP-binding protein n=1 Tax=Aureibacter tunicatorum TaxID=866807 RepID=A0AAE3XPW4_9BACT|nr:Crp/Fnr family transcriptional regulator [Aureibacter tunicatorum]MDR6239164.1 CRP-like cAMP-binding protein [Aureibacter tunicatorum]BDD04910.1 Crp/Fnr family transcriptional regulator [Aureibacter tunicatorum]
MINEDVLLQWGAKKINVQKGEFIFKQEDKARYYYQVQNGQVKMSNFNDEGKEFIQGIFNAGESFGEPPLFGEFLYPSNAIATENSEILRLDFNEFKDLLRDRSDIHLEFTKTLAMRLYYKSLMQAEISSENPSHRILTLLEYWKERYGNGGDYEMPLTRQEIANLTGLRVETTIRTIKKLELEGALKIINKKVVF